jgi:hypothetical protein
VDPAVEEEEEGWLLDEDEWRNNPVDDDTFGGEGEFAVNTTERAIAAATADTARKTITPINTLRVRDMDFALVAEDVGTRMYRRPTIPYECLFAIQSNTKSR